VWAKRDLKAGDRLLLDDVSFAIPTQPGQLITNDLSKYTDISVTSAIEAGAPVRFGDVSIVDNREKVYEIIRKVQSMIKESGVIVPSRLDMEISHHYGIENFDMYGCVLITFINKTYCKKLIFVLPGQSHPPQYHVLKEETFNILHGDLQIQLDTMPPLDCSPGDTVDVLPNMIHAFSSREGAIIEEISTTHDKGDSYYIDKTISKNKSRKTEITNWRDK
jgi:mannose-6-phosphate isomerase-like protein (cupin superfamily)